MRRETSREVFEQIKESGILTGLRWNIYHCLFQNGPLTQIEVCKFFPHKREHSITPRFAELEKMNAIQIVGKRTCTITGKDVHIWDVTRNLPRKIVKTLKVKCIHCDGKGHHELITVEKNNNVQQNASS